MKKIMNSLKLNKGFSLVELIVTVAILAIVGVSLITLIGISTGVFRKQSNEVNVQYQSQMAAGQISDLILSANNGLSWDAANHKLYIYSAEYDDAGNLIKNTTVITWDDTEKKLFFENPTTTSPELMAAEITNFAVDILDEYGNLLDLTADSMEARKIVIRYAYDYESRTYDETASCSLRNNILVSADATKFYNGLPDAANDAVNAVVIEVPNVSTNHIWVGESTGDFPFNTDVIGYNVTDTSFVWSFGQPYADSNDGSAILTNANGSKVNTNTGNVQVGLDERTNFNVIGTSVMSQTLAAAGKGTPKSGAILIYPKYIVSANATSPNLAGFDYIKDTELKYQVRVTVKNGVGTELERNQVAATLSSTIKDDRGVSIFDPKNNPYNSKLGPVTYKGGYSSADSYTYIFEQILTNPPKDYSFVYTATCNGYGINTKSSVSAILNQPYEFTRLQLMSTSPVNVYPGEKTMCRVYITKHYLVDNNLNDEIIDVTDAAELKIEAGSEYATLSNGLLTIDKGNTAETEIGKTTGPIKVTAKYKDPVFGKEFVAERNFTINPLQAYLVQKDGKSQVPNVGILTAGSGETDFFFEIENATKHPEKMSIASVTVENAAGGSIDPGIIAASVSGGNKVVINSNDPIPVPAGAVLETDLYPYRVAKVKVEWKGGYTNQLRSAPYNYDFVDTSYDTGVYETYLIMVGNANVHNGPTPDRYTKVFVPGNNIMGNTPFDTADTALKSNGNYILDNGTMMHFDIRDGILPGAKKRIVFYKTKANTGGDTLKSSSGGLFWEY